MESNSNNHVAAKPQTVCIDLPGESVRCWRSTDKVQVILKKHRDIILDLKISAERTYTLESTGSDFYHADKKKLISGRGAQRVHFNDGERLHFWVARDFKGELLLKSAGQLMLKIDPSKLDSKKYDSSPSTKPDPIVVAIGGSTRSPKAQGNQAIHQPAKQQAIALGQQARPMAAVELGLLKKKAAMGL